MSKLCMAMKRSFFLCSIILLLALHAFAGGVFANPDPPVRNSIIVHVDGLTSAVRDGLSNDLKGRDLRMVYACVPAGIMVFEEPGASPEKLRTDVMPVLERRIAMPRIKVEEIDRAAAEQRCAQARNR
jgi:hypothetical protein